MMVVEGLIGASYASPPPAETGRVVPHPVIAIQYDAVYAVVTAVQQVLVNVAQSVRHEDNGTRLRFSISTHHPTQRLIAES
jgi:hypothetical protein